MYKKILIGLLALFIIAKPVAAFAPNAYVHDLRVAPWQRMIQGDDRWADVSHGLGTIRDRGCFTTSVAILMAYANENLRNIDTWNPKIATPILSPGGLLDGSRTTQVDAHFRLVNQRFIDNRVLSPEEATSIITDLWLRGYYIVIRTTGMLSSMTHFSPIVGIDDNGIPVVWDTAGHNGSHNFIDWANHGIDRIAIWSHVNPSFSTQMQGIFEGEIDWDRERLASIGGKSNGTEYHTEESEDTEAYGVESTPSIVDLEAPLNLQ